jgi:hypothetical protein
MWNPFKKDQSAPFDSDAAKLNLHEEAFSLEKDAYYWYSFYWWINQFLFWGIPVLSTLLASNAFVSLLPASAAGPARFLVWLTVLLSLMTIINSAIKPKDQYEKNASFMVRFQQYNATYEIERELVTLNFESDVDFKMIMRQWNIFKIGQFLRLKTAYLNSEDAPEPDVFVFKGKAIYSSTSQPGTVGHAGARSDDADQGHRDDGADSRKIPNVAKTG